MSTSPEKTWFGQPRGLTILFLTNMWEQFSYYGMRALLVYYMTKQLLIAQEQSSFIYGTYTACAYFTPIVGGVIADRWLGKRRAVIIGGSIMALGHFMMAFEPLFFAALATIALGNGLFLPSLPSQIDDLYERRRSAPRAGRTTSITSGINIGGFLAPLICGTLGEAVRLALRLRRGRRRDVRRAWSSTCSGSAICRPKTAPASSAVRQRQPNAQASTARRLLLLGVGIAVTVFRGAYEQVGNTVAAVGRQRRRPDAAAALAIPMTWFQSLNPLLVMLHDAAAVAALDRRRRRAAAKPRRRARWPSAR